ncbi:hypothetical protein ACH4UM_23575 [Streptomyces sp. NPDC020801]|uniref:DUF6197 family protein n=1 Tax=unclassified Streptomyces TaxID=2593676 RepID=UPI0037BACB58
MNTTSPTRAEVADLCEKAAAVIATQGHCQGHLYDTRQAAGLPVEKCRVDVIGALNVAAHGTPRYAASPLVAAAERALTSRIEEPCLVTWNDKRGRRADHAVTLLQTTAIELRTEPK